MAARQRSLLLAAVLLPAVLIGVQGSGISSSEQWHDAMYLRGTNQACVRLLNATSVIGCAGPHAMERVDGLLTPADCAQRSEPDAAVFVVPPASLSALLSSIGSNATLRNRTAGVLVEAGRPTTFSAAPTGPAPLAVLPGQQAHAWNPKGNGISALDIGIPVFQLDEQLSAWARDKAAWNAGQGFAGRQHSAALRLSMRGENSSVACLPQQPGEVKKCDPLGGHSVWAAMPPLPREGRDRMPVVVVAAGVDTAALFHGLAKGADAPLSGLIAMLAAMDVLHNASIAEPFSRRLVFVALSGEPWDAMGSRRLLWQMHTGSNATDGLHIDDIEQVLEVGQVGLASMHDGGVATRLFTHTDERTGAGPAAPLADALAAAAAATHVPVTLTAAHGGHGLPPGVAMSFARVKPEVASVVLAEYDEAYINPYYHSQYDDITNIDAGAIAATAEVLSRALMQIGTGGERRAASLQVDARALHDLVSGLIGCLLQDDPGLGCWLAGGLFSPPVPKVSHYIGVLKALSEDDQDPLPGVKKPVERFLWTYMANRTAARRGQGATGSGGDGPCDFVDHKCESGSVCIGHKYLPGNKQQEGVCQKGTARYVPSYSLHFKPTTCRGGVCWGFNLTDEATAWEAQHEWPQDGMWTESQWPVGVPQLMLYLREATGHDAAVLVAGAVVAAGSAAAILAAHVYLAWLKKVQ